MLFGAPKHTAIALDITEETVKARLHRVRALLQKELQRNVGASHTEFFGFMLFAATEW